MAFAIRYASYRRRGTSRLPFVSIGSRIDFSAQVTGSQGLMAIAYKRDVNKYFAAHSAAKALFNE